MFPLPLLQQVRHIMSWYMPEAGVEPTTCRRNSYKCQENTPIIAASAQSVRYSSLAEDSGTGSDVPVPAAEFVSN